MKPFYRTLQIALLALALCVALVGVVAQDAFAASNSTLASHQSARSSCPPTIANGSTGHWVKVLQATLNFDGWRDPNGRKLAVDGRFGPKTLFAVKNFQSIYAPPADGIVGPKTWRALGYCHTGIFV